MPSSFERRRGVAALPLAGGHSVARALQQRLSESKRTSLITGIGGGVASIAAQLALSANADVYVTSSTDQKLDAAMTWGCVGTANYSEASWWRALRKQVPTGFDVIFDGAGGSQVDELLNLLSPGGRFVFYGGRGVDGRKFSLSICFLSKCPFWRQPWVHQRTSKPY